MKTAELINQIISGPTTEYLKHLLAVRAEVDAAIVEAVSPMHLFVRVAEEKISDVSAILAADWPPGWKIEVGPLGYVQRFVRGIHVFA